MASVTAAIIWQKSDGYRDKIPFALPNCEIGVGQTNAKQAKKKWSSVENWRRWKSKWIKSVCWGHCVRPSNSLSNVQDVLWDTSTTSEKWIRGCSPWYDALRIHFQSTLSQHLQKYLILSTMFQTKEETNKMKVQSSLAAYTTQRGVSCKPVHQSLSVNVEPRRLSRMCKRGRKAREWCFSSPAVLSLALVSLKVFDAFLRLALWGESLNIGFFKTRVLKSKLSDKLTSILVWNELRRVTNFRFSISHRRARADEVPQFLWNWIFHSSCRHF